MHSVHGIEECLVCDRHGHSLKEMDKQCSVLQEISGKLEEQEDELTPWFTEGHAAEGMRGYWHPS